MKTKRRINNKKNIKKEMLNLHNYAASKNKTHKANLQFCEHFLSMLFNWSFIIGFVCCCNTLCSIKFQKVNFQYENVNEDLIIKPQYVYVWLHDCATA